MVSFLRRIALAAILAQSVNAAPTSVNEALSANNVSELLSILGNQPSGAVNAAPTSVNEALSANYVSELLSILRTQPSGAEVSDAADLESKLKAIWNTQPGGSIDFYGNVQKQISGNIIPPGLLSDFISVLGGVLTDLADAFEKLVGPFDAADSIDNNNPTNPSKSIFPKKEAADAPYSLSEQQLRQAIFIPGSFTKGEKPPVIFIPGTGVYGSETFAHNQLKLLSNVPYADPVWLNIPGALLDDAQVNSEYVAYAINYISGIANRNVSLVSWSQGGLDAQWAFTFWPSTRKVVSNFLPVSPDFHGTVEANVLCLSSGSGAVNAPCDPSVIQQAANSRFLQTLASHGGTDAYVPTTTFYSAVLDEIVEPQQGTGASAFINDGRHVGVTNVELQSVCAGRVAGGFYGHATTLINPLTAALIKDALQNGGPAKVSRINLDEVCSTYIAPGLSVSDGVATAGSIIIAGIRLLAKLPKLTTEPAIMSYA